MKKKLVVFLWIFTCISFLSLLTNCVFAQITLNNNTQIYNNTKYGIKFKYPSNWELTEPIKESSYLPIVEIHFLPEGDFLRKTVFTIIHKDNDNRFNGSDSIPFEFPVPSKSIKDLLLKITVEPLAKIVSDKIVEELEKYDPMPASVVYDMIKIFKTIYPGVNLIESSPAIVDNKPAHKIIFTFDINGIKVRSLMIFVFSENGFYTLEYSANDGPDYDIYLNNINYVINTLELK